jgi:hypothetical protein
VALIALIAGLLSACSHKVVAPRVENQRPVVRLVSYPATPAERYDYAYTMHWVGFDPDGDVVGYLYTVDAPAPTAERPEAETTWVSTQDHERQFSFTATAPESGLTYRDARSSDYHVFVIKAVDNKGLMSVPAVIAFNSETLAPTVSIFSPVPRGPVHQLLTPSLEIQWVGSDPDGRTSQLPVYYRTKLLTQNTEVQPQTALQFPDSVQGYYRPRGWPGWDSLPGSATSQHLENLAPEQDYAFCVVAFDEAGAYTPIMSDVNNLLYFRTVYSQFAGPRLTLFNDFFTYTYASPFYLPNDPRYEIPLEIPANTTLDVNWTAEPYVGTSIAYYRWVVDPEDLADNRPRTNETTDIRHWSVASSITIHATVPAMVVAGDHHFFVEATDNNGLRSLGHIHFQSIVPIFNREIGIVDDTRLTVDRDLLTTPTCVERPLGIWPTASELDTFLYARGGVPIRCYPAGSVSRAGLFAGYDFDTVNTRTQLTDLTVPLSQLAHYRRVIWLVDATAPANSPTGNNAFPTSSGDETAMRYMNSAGHTNTLAAYLRMGGEAWLAGGGCLYASIIPWNVTSNDHPYRYFSRSAGEIRPGRFMYDYAHWRNDLKLGSATQMVRSLGRLESSPGPYAALPLALQAKSLAAGDSLPAWRSASDFYLGNTDVEGMSLANSIVEDYDPTAQGEDLRSTLDTLYQAVGGTMNGAVVMTVYHGLDSPRLIVSGFNLWSFQLPQLRQLVDGVLKGLWGLSPTTQPVRLRPTAPRTWQPALVPGRSTPTARGAR